MPASVTPLPRRVAQVASRRHGIIDFGELIRTGIAHSTLNEWVASGHIHRIHEGVYSIVPPSLLTREGRWLSAVLACGPGAALSHGAAGQHSGIVDRHERPGLHVTVPNRSRRRIPGIIIHRPRSLQQHDVIVLDGIPTTTVTRTVWDIASVSAPGPTRRAFRQAEKFGRLDRSRLAALAAGSPSRKGSGLIRELLAERAVPLAAVRSWLEELLMTICADNGLPFPAVNVPLLGYEVDFLWPHARFVVEADGGDHLDPTQRDRDNERDFVLGRAGYLVRRYSSKAMGRERVVVGEVLGILRERGPRSSPGRAAGGG